MTTIAEFAAPAEGFPLGELFGELPEVTVELERVVPTGRGLFPYFWTRGVDVSRVKRRMKRSAVITSFTVVDALQNEGLFRAKWDEDSDGIIGAIVESDVTLLSTNGTADRWLFEVRGTTDVVSAFHRRCLESGVRMELDRLRAITEIGSDRSYDLTDDQHEALCLAYRSGYYENPRDATLGDLAADLGISRQAVGARLRRGHGTLVRETIAPRPRSEMSDPS